MPRSPSRLAAAPPPTGSAVALVTEGPDRHARQLTRALAARGARAVPLKLSDCAIATASPAGLTIPGFDGSLPDAVLVRSLAGGAFEAVTLRLGILHALRESGVRVWNDARAIERCVDKSMTSFLLRRAGIPTPATWAAESRELARAIVRREVGRAPLVLKPLFGSQGRGLTLIRGAEDLPAPNAVAGGVYYLQRYVAVVGDHFHDFRLLVSCGRVVAAMARHASSWITNVKQGGRPVAVVADPQMRDLAIRAAAVVGADFAGVDLIRGADSSLYVLEVNSMPAWSGLQKVTAVDITAILAGDLLAAIAPAVGRAAM